MPRHQQSSGGSNGVVTPSRRDDRSGLLDIHALSSVIDAQRRGGSSVSPSLGPLAAMPTFGSPWALQDLRPTAPVVQPTRPTPAVVVGPDNRPLYVMIAALSIAVASLGAFVLLRPAPTVIVEHAAVAAPVAVEEPEEPPAAEPSKAPLVAMGQPDPSEAEAEAEAIPAPEAERSPTPRAGRTPRTKATPPPIPKTTPKEESLSVDCIIDPRKCGKGKTEPRLDTDDPPPSSKDLPAAPSSSQIRTAMAEVKPQAKACGATHGGREGDKVRVKLSVVGSTGRVTSAQALDDHAGTALGRCVAAALAKATLPRFAKPQTGVVFSVTL
jgi:hypothetical protein